MVPPVGNAPTPVDFQSTAYTILAKMGCNNIFNVILQPIQVII